MCHLSLISRQLIHGTFSEINSAKVLNTICESHAILACRCHHLMLGYMGIRSAHPRHFFSSLVYKWQSPNLPRGTIKNRANKSNYESFELGASPNWISCCEAESDTSNLFQSLLSFSCHQSGANEHVTGFREHVLHLAHQL